MRLKYSFRVMELDNELVAIPTGKVTGNFNGVIKLNGSASVIFEMLKNDTTPEAITAELCKTYENAAEELAAYVDRFIASLKAENLLAE